MLFIHFLLLLPVAIVGAPNEHIDNSLPDSKTPVKDVIHNHNSADSSDKSGKDERQFHAEDVTESESRRVKRNALRDRSKRWPKGRVPYTIANNFTDQQLAEIMEGMQQFAKVSCIRFEPKRDDDVDYVYIYPLTTVCGSKIGRVGGEQALVLSPRCSNKRTILHEMMHAIGFHHEHNRADRDDYVDIYERFIQPGAEDEFKKRTLDEIDHLGMEYDYSSIMHYGKRTFAAGRWPPMWPKKNGVEIGNKQEFSETDIKKINIYYECPQEGETTTTRESEPTTTTTEKLPTEGETTTTGESGSTTTKTTTTTTTTTKQPPTGCADVADFCHSVRLYGVCHLRAAYTYCQKTCERCNEAPPHTPEPDPACVDEVPYCERYFHICGEFPDDLGPKCKKTCELCGKPKPTKDVMKECIEKHGAEKCNRWEETCARIMAKPLARHHGQPNTAAFNYGAVASCLQRLQEDPMKLCVDMYGKETCSKFEKACADKLSAEKVNSAGSFSSEAIDCVLAQFNA